MRRSLLLALPVVLVCSLAGCRGKSLARAELRGPGTAEASFQANGKKLALWADTDGSWRGGDDSVLEVDYVLDISVNGQSSQARCSTRDSSSSVCGSKVTVNDDHRGNCERKLKCDLPEMPAGANVVLRVTARPGANVSEVKDMSINVRAD